MEGRAHTARVGEDLAERDEDGKRDGESKAQSPVQPSCESEAADRGKQSFPEPGVMVESAICQIVLNRQGHAGRNAGSQAKEEAKPEAITDAEDNGVRYRAGKQPQRTVLSAQQVIRKIERTQHIKARTHNADGRDGMVVHSTIVEPTALLNASHQAVRMKIPAKFVL